MITISGLSALNGRFIPALFCLTFMMIALFPGASFADPHRGHGGHGYYGDTRPAYRDDDDGDDIDWRVSRDRRGHTQGRGHSHNHDNRYFQPVNYVGCGRDGRAYYNEGRYIVARGWCTSPRVTRHPTTGHRIYTSPSQFVFVFD